MEAYIISYEGKISQEAYSTLKEAQEYIAERLGVSEYPEDFYEGWDERDRKYEITVVRIK